VSYDSMEKCVEYWPYAKWNHVVFGKQPIHILPSTFGFVRFDNLYEFGGNLVRCIYNYRTIIRFYLLKIGE